MRAHTFEIPYLLGALQVVTLAMPADAQIVRNGGPLESPPAEYVVPPQVPAGGCVWDNAVFSNGAIFERYIRRPFYFRCMNGQWQSFYSFNEARAGRDDSSALNRSQRPTPIR
jgi:hypothetical protein